MSDGVPHVEAAAFSAPQRRAPTAPPHMRFVVFKADDAPASPPQAKPPRPNRETDAREVVRPKRGQTTYDCEGNEGGRWASRYLHVPSDESGLTVGRGYDMKMKSPERIAADLKGVGLGAAEAELLAQASGLKGPGAKQFIVDHKLEEFSLTPQQQADLFDVVYADEAAVARRICMSEEVQKKYGAVDWDKLDPAIQEMLIDLKYRGDYTARSRAFLQAHVVANDLPAFAKALGDRDLWKDVPENRFQRRKAFIENAVKEAAAANPEKP